MTKPKPVVVALPLDHQTDELLATVLDLGRRMKCPIVVVHALGKRRMESPAGMSNRIAKAKQTLGLRLQPLWDAGLEVREEVAVGTPADLAIHTALRVSAQLIVTGQGKPATIRRWMVGSAVEAIVHRAVVPVWVVHGEGTGGRPVLCPIHLNSPSEAGLASAVRMARIFEVPLRVMTVLPDNSAGEGPSVEEARRSLEEMLAKQEAGGVDVAVNVVTGNPAERIIDAADDAGMVVIGSRGFNPLVPKLLDPVTTRALRHSQCSILASPADIAIDAAGVLYIADNSNGLIRTVSTDGRITRFAGGGASFADGALLSTTLPGMTSLVFDSRGGLVAAVSSSRQIRRVNAGVVTTIAGILPSASAGENVSALSTSILDPIGIAFDASGNLHYTDQIDNRVRRISPAGLVTTTAGNGIFGGDGNDGLATNAQVGVPRGLAFDRTGNLFIVSGFGAGVRRVATTGIITTLVGGRGAGFSGDGGAATQAQLFNPIGIATDSDGHVFIADAGNHRIRRVDAATQVISTVAGTGEAGFSGDGGPAISAQLSSPRFLAFDPAGNLLISDLGNRRIRRISRTGVITTIAGTGETGATGDGGPATAANIGNLTGIAVDTSSNIYFAGVNRIRRITPAGIISTIAGTGAAGFTGESSLATNATMDTPGAVAIDAAGAIHFVDQRNFRIRKLTPSPIVAEGITNGATLKVGPVAPGEIISIFGFDLGPAGGVGLALDETGKVTNSLAGTQVLFDGVPAPLLYVSQGQINTVVPYGVAGKTTTRVQVQINGRITGTTTLQVTAASPGLFAITNENGSLNTASNPAARGSVLVLYGTGEGQTIPEGVDGGVATAVFPKPVQEVSVTIGGRPATVLYAGAAPGFVSGVFQLNVTIPAGLNGTLPIQVKIGEATTPAGLNISVR